MVNTIGVWCLPLLIVKMITRLFIDCHDGSPKPLANRILEADTATEEDTSLENGDHSSTAAAINTLTS